AKILAVPANEICPLFEHWQSIADVPEMRLRQIQHFFEHYKDLEEGKWVKVIGWAGVDEAHAEILDSVKRYEAETHR
ncbi:MAG TPA: inorganic diphosphatase, partial [Steroidobacteraceae bacterium]|nr:inorganic diphosphatase [Steroidobacteraceae bacterium]